MHNLHASRFVSMTLATLLGFATPIGLDLAIQDSATATPGRRLTGVFDDDDWSVSLFENTSDGFTYFYTGTDLVSGSSLRLADGRPTLDWTDEREEWVWENDAYRYIIAWRWDDPDFIRLRVIDPNGYEILNRLLERNRDPLLY